MSQAQLDSFLAIGVGFALAGFVMALYRAVREQPISFEMLFVGGPTSMLAIPLLAVAGPGVIMRNTIRGRRYEQRKMHFVAMATVLASLWSLMIGYGVMRVL